MVTKRASPSAQIEGMHAIRLSKREDADDEPGHDTRDEVERSS
jgi:hypothetical protein